MQDIYTGGNNNNNGEMVILSCLVVMYDGLNKQLMYGV